MCANWLQSSHSVPSSSSVGIPGIFADADSPMEVSALVGNSARAIAEAPASQNWRRLRVVLDCAFFRNFNVCFITTCSYPHFENNYAIWQLSVDVVYKQSSRMPDSTGSSVSRTRLFVFNGSDHYQKPGEATNTDYPSVWWVEFCL